MHLLFFFFYLQLVFGCTYVGVLLYISVQGSKYLFIPLAGCHQHMSAPFCAVHASDL